MSKVDESKAGVDRGSSTPRATSIPPLGASTAAADLDGDLHLPVATIDMETFEQILDLDDEDSHEFSRGMAWAYFDQVAKAFQDLDAAMASKDLHQLSELGHFLKGSSAALGVSKVQESCEKIQHYGLLRDEEANIDLSPSVALDKIAKLLVDVKLQYAAAEKWLRDWYAKNDKSEA